MNPETTQRNSPEIPRIIDAHLHCGVQNVLWPWEGVRDRLLAAGIRGAGLIPPVEDIYDRYDPTFTDTPAWQATRRRAHRYLLDLADPEIQIFPYFFVWNDFAWEELGEGYAAIKWHRHGDEPEYRYEDPRCREFLAVVHRRGLPILLEETFAHTLFFLEKLLPPGVPLIIPHLGGLNGGYRALARAGVWSLPCVWADTSLASPGELEDYLGRFGSERLIFGSDYPFGDPGAQLARLRRLGLPPAVERGILGDNFRRLLAGRNPGKGPGAG
ncbi:MAG: amidohydrolase [Syntrophobacterales bacterium]|nr:amidohydrolase [Syntrophobacterales bacterium]